MAQAKLAAVILAAGQGTRMKSDRAKVLHALAGEPLVRYPLALARDLGAEPIVLVVGHQKDAVREKVESMFPGAVAFAEQNEQRGTGHAVMQAMRALDSHSGPVLLLYGDVPLLRKETLDRLLSEAKEERRVLSIVTTVLDPPAGYGRVVRDERRRIQRIVEEKDASPAEKMIQEINAGIYQVDRGFLAFALERLTDQNAQKEYYLTDIIGLAIADGHEVGSLVVGDPSEVLGANTRGELAILDRVVRRRTNDRLMKEGVTIVDPDQTYISARARIGRDTVIQPGVHIRGETEIGRDCVVDAGVVIEDSKIEDGVEIKPYSLIDHALVEKGAIIGPFARLRPAARVREGAHVGNFVELKNTELGRGAKANHLAYLGDASIGAGSNIGAGTITCNYDGYGKYRTEIGQNVFIGSNSTLVAPVGIADNAYVAAGSTITDPVGPNDLAFGRARQAVKPGYAAELRARAAEQAAAAAKAKKEKSKAK